MSNGRALIMSSLSFPRIPRHNPRDTPGARRHNFKLILRELLILSNIRHDNIAAVTSTPFPCL
jgi:hypothetical protein